MATYLELRQLSENSNLRIRCAVACVIAAESIRTESESTLNHANKMLWAKSVFSNPDAVSQSVLWAVLAANSSFSVEAIQAASDLTLQNAVNNAINIFAGV